MFQTFKNPLLLQLTAALVMSMEPESKILNIMAENRGLLMSIALVNNTSVFDCLCLRTEAKCKGYFRNEVSLEAEDFILGSHERFGVAQCSVRSYDSKKTFSKKKMAFMCSGKPSDSKYCETDCRVLGLNKVRDGCFLLTVIFWQRGKIDLPYVLYCPCQGIFFEKTDLYDLVPAEEVEKIKKEEKSEESFLNAWWWYLIWAVLVSVMFGAAGIFYQKCWKRQTIPRNIASINFNNISFSSFSEGNPDYQIPTHLASNSTLPETSESGSLNKSEASTGSPSSLEDGEQKKVIFTLGDETIKISSEQEMKDNLTLTGKTDKDSGSSSSYSSVQDFDIEQKDNIEIEAQSSGERTRRSLKCHKICSPKRASIPAQTNKIPGRKIDTQAQSSSIPIKITNRRPQENTSATQGSSIQTQSKWRL